VCDERAEKPAERRTVLALDLSNSRSWLGLVDSVDGLLELRTLANTSQRGAVFWREVLRVAEEVAARASEPLAGIGVAFGGPVGRDGRARSLHVPGWADIDLVGDLRARFGLPVRIENDANCGALGEFHHGGWGELGTLVFMTCSTGIGGGIVSDGHLLRGSRGMAGEVGHCVVAPDGLPCPCGSRGCLEAQCSGSAIARRAMAALTAGRGRPSLLANKVVAGELPGAKPVFEAAAAGDALAREVLAAVFADFGRGLAMVFNIFDPDLIVVGGGVSLAGRDLTAPVAAAAQSYLVPCPDRALRFEPAALGLHSQLWGAAALILGPAV